MSDFVFIETRTRGVKLINVKQIVCIQYRDQQIFSVYYSDSPNTNDLISEEECKKILKAIGYTDCDLESILYHWRRAT